MSLQVGNYNLNNIGRMFARQNVGAVYGKHKGAADETESGGGAAAVDKVTFSANVPAPVPARSFEEAADAGAAIADGGALSPEQTERIRADRVFAAMSALAALGATGGEDDRLVAWPGGIPSPTAEELEVARRRLSQRLQDPGQAQNPQSAMQERLELLRKIGGIDSATAAARIGGQSLGGDKN